MADFGPPKRLERWLRSRLPADFEEVIAGDLAEEYEERRARNRVGAWLWYVGQALTIDTAALRRAAQTTNGRWARDTGHTTSQGITPRGTIDMLAQDIRYAIRRLWKSPGFTIVAVLSLSLGIGANSALFTLVNGLFFQDDGIQEPERVVQIYWDGNTPYWSISWNWYRAMQEDLGETFEAVTAHRMNPVRSEPTGDRLITATFTSGDYFGVMGVDFMMGRGFIPGVETDVEGGPSVVVLSHNYWRTVLGGRPDVVGSTVRIDAIPHTILGILPEGFAAKSRGIASDLYLPDPGAVANPGSDNLVGGARLAAGISLDQATAGLARVAAEFQANRSPELTPIAFNMIQESEVQFDPGVDEAAAPIVGLLFGVVLLVLVIACTNLASFLLARAADRRKEFAIRRAIGAGRGRVVTQLLVESLILAGIGAGVGIALAQLSLKAILAIELPIPVSLSVATNVDLSVLLFTLAVAGFAGVLFGIFPALTAGREEVSSTLRDESAGAGGGRGKVGLRGALVVAQVSLSLALLIGAGLFIRSLLTATSVDPGFERMGRAVVTVDPGNSGYVTEQSQRILEQTLSEVRQLPDVEVATLANRVPLQMGIWRSGIRRPDRAFSSAREFTYPQFAYIGDDFFETLGIDVLSGRGISAEDVEGSPRVVVLNQALAQLLWPEDPDVVGRTVVMSNWPDEPVTVVGVVETSKVATLAEDPEPYLYVPFRQSGQTQALVIARPAGGSELALANRMRDLAKQIDPEMYVHSATTVEDMTGTVLFLPRMGAIVLAIFGGLALLLASIGLYGLVSFGVKRREKEVGIRLSLGADPDSVVRMIMRSGTRLVIIGVTIGVVLGGASGFFLEQWLFDVPALDPVTLIIVPAVLVGISLLASWLPARRAAIVDPVESLRNE